MVMMMESRTDGCEQEMEREEREPWRVRVASQARQQTGGLVIHRH